MKSVTMNVGTRLYKELNASVKEEFLKNDEVVLQDVYGQKYIGAGLDSGKTIKIHGTPGNDMAAYMNGGNIEVFGNGQDAVGNTMNDGKIIIHGNSGDAVGYAMRGGEIYIKGNAGYRSGIHMKEFETHIPIIVIGGKAGSYLAEYMAGGKIIVLGLGIDGDKTGEFLAAGIHGGELFIRGELPEGKVIKNVTIEEATEDDKKRIAQYIKNYCDYFSADYEALIKDKYTRIAPKSNRPFAAMFTKS